jgi:hypothetical protein
MQRHQSSQTILMERVFDFCFPPVITETVTRQAPFALPISAKPLATQTFALLFGTVSVTRLFLVIDNLAEDAKALAVMDLPTFTLGAPDTVVETCVNFARIVGDECVNPLADNFIQPSLSETAVTAVLDSPSVSTTEIVIETGSRVKP